jgi:hypothetical protein
MSEKEFETIEDYVIASIRIAMINRPKHGTLGFSLTIHEDQIVGFEISKSERFKTSGRAL